MIVRTVKNKRSYPDVAGSEVANTTLVMVASFCWWLPSAEFHLKTGFKKQCEYITHTQKKFSQQIIAKIIRQLRLSASANKKIGSGSTLKVAAPSMLEQTKTISFRISSVLSKVELMLGAGARPSDLLWLGATEKYQLRLRNTVYNKKV